MASTSRTRHGASARAGGTASKKKPAARVAPARASRTPAARVSPARKPASAPKRAAAAKKRGGVPILPIAIVVAVLMLGWFLYPMARLRYAEQRKVARLQTQLTSLQQRNSKLKREVERLKTPQGVEEAAHELGLARPGEQVWVTLEGGKVTSAPTTASPVRTAEAAPDVWTQVLDAIFGVSP